MPDKTQKLRTTISWGAVIKVLLILIVTVVVLGVIFLVLWMVTLPGCAFSPAPC